MCAGTRYMWGWGSCVHGVQAWGHLGVWDPLGHGGGSGFQGSGIPCMGLGMGTLDVRGSWGWDPHLGEVWGCGFTCTGQAGPTCQWGPMGWAGGGHGVPTVSCPRRDRCGAGSDLPRGGVGVWGGSWGWGGGGCVPPPACTNPALSHCAAGDTGRGMAPTFLLTPSAPRPSSDWVGRGPGWS